MDVTTLGRSRRRLARAVPGLVAMMVLCGGFVTATELRPPGAPWVTPLEIDFGPVGVGATSGSLNVIITNTGSETLTSFAGGGVLPPFSSAQNCAGGVPPGASCQYSFTFSPTTAGAFTATSHSSTSAGWITIVMHGEGVGPGLHVTPLALDFGSVFNGSSGTQQIVTIRNTGQATLAGFSGGGVSPPFSGAQNCAGGVAPGASCQYFFDFSPTETGVFTASSNSNSNAGPFSITLEGRGRSIIFGSGQRVTPRSIDFGPVAVGALSGTEIVVVTNQSPISPITGFSGGGVNPPFSAMQTCVPELAAGASCQYRYTFLPEAVGVFSATSTVTDSAGTFSIQLRGEGVGGALHVSPLVLDFGPVPVGSLGDTQVVTVTNTGMAAVTGFSGGGVAYPFSAAQSCVPSLAPGESCQYTYNFAAGEIGMFTATSTVTTNAGSFSIRLIGGDDVPLFSDDFESGGTSQWGTAVP